MNFWRIISEILIFYLYLQRNYKGLVKNDCSLLTKIKHYDDLSMSGQYGTHNNPRSGLC